MKQFADRVFASTSVVTGLDKEAQMAYRLVKIYRCFDCPNYIKGSKHRVCMSINSISMSLDDVEIEFEVHPNCPLPLETTVSICPNCGKKLERSNE